MDEQIRKFTCVIKDRLLHERYSVDVTVKKKLPVWTSIQPGKIDLADIFITPKAGQPLKERVHNHFVLYDAGGNGLHIVRNQQRREEHRLPCTIWDLGQSFALQVLAAIKDMA